MNKSDLIEAVAAELKGNKTEAAKAVQAVLECITRGIKADEKVAISGFGTFLKKKRSARTGINPITKQPIAIKPSTSCGFRPSASLKEVL